MDFRFAMLGALLEPQGDYQSLFWPVGLEAWAIAKERLELAGDPDSPLVEEEKIRLAAALQAARDKRAAADAAQKRQAKEGEQTK